VRAGGTLLAIVAVGKILTAMVASEIIVGIAMAAVRRNVRFITVGKRRSAKIAQSIIVGISVLAGRSSSGNRDTSCKAT
jgi:hypothetical protein